jgi:hypothetical protein
MNLQRSTLFSLLIPLVFGIPFLLLTDLFPFHRYGMFARIPNSKTGPEVRILLANRDTTLALETGSPCLDRGILARLAEAGFSDQKEAHNLLDKIRPSLNPFPDSILLEQKQNSGWQRKRIYP